MGMVQLKLSHLAKSLLQKLIKLFLNITTSNENRNLCNLSIRSGFSISKSIDGDG